VAGGEVVRVSIEQVAMAMWFGYLLAMHSDVEVSEIEESAWADPTRAWERLPLVTLQVWRERAKKFLRAQRRIR
jgi:hypothetical protein